MATAATENKRYSGMATREKGKERKTHQIEMARSCMGGSGKDGREKLKSCDKKDLDWKGT